ncbi:hypothetical protein THIAE_01940 [Thiomicrospira aerophila AL3]|uniref:Uncharacterized protein n=1 Tax=Thiomicrospira aerophila AL3 TaxID=717772 RepID=W0DUU0_9GAMM|nr:hypothetical protein [Thiomicrospira aerophila]AHF02187.1 hypothetical protein THIAE_01940 [Thiomicrospira aerophila AL3]
MAENNSNNPDDIDDIDALLDELSNEKLDPDMAAFDDSTDLVDKDVTFSDQAPESSQPAEISSTAEQPAFDKDPISSSDDSFLNDAAMMAATTAVASAAAINSNNAAKPSQQNIQETQSTNQSQFDEFDELTGIDEMDPNANKPVTVMLTDEQAAQLQKTKSLSLLSAGLMITFSLGAFIMASLAWLNSGSGHLTGAIQVQHENSEQQRLLLQSINQQLSTLEQKVDVSRLLIDDLLAQAQSESNQTFPAAVAEVAPPAPVAPTPVAAPSVQVNTDALQRRIEQVQRTANTIQSRVTEINKQFEQLSVQQQNTTKAVRELEKAWLEQLLAQKEQQLEQQAEESATVAPDAYRYVAPNSHFSFP